MPLPTDYLPAHTVFAPRSRNPAAQVVVVGPSIGTTSRIWAREVRALGEEFRVISYEHPGHGAAVAGHQASTGPGPAPAGPYRIGDLAAAVLRILDRYRVASAHIIGLSLGGAVAQWLGMHAPDRVASLGIACSAAAFPPTGMWTERAAAVRQAGSVATPEIADGLPARWLTAGFRLARPDVADELVAGLGAIDPEGYAGCCEALASWDATGGGDDGDLAGITARTLLVAGEHDPATPPAALQRLADSIAGSRLEVVDASHLAPVEVDLSQLILGHLRAC